MHQKIYIRSLIRRLKRTEKLNLQSWIDLFFTHDVHILGLSLDFVEIDIWWLLTYRVRSKYYKKSSFIENNLYYYIPDKYVKNSADKIQLLKANDVQVVVINENNNTEYYKKVIDKIKKRYDS